MLEEGRGLKEDAIDFIGAIDTIDTIAVIDIIDAIQAIILMIVYLDNLEIPSLSRIPRLSRATMVIKLAHTDRAQVVCCTCKNITLYYVVMCDLNHVLWKNNACILSRMNKIPIFSHYL